MRRAISFEESCARPCALSLTVCGGPTASGLDGYACENCLEFVLKQCESGAVARACCEYCGSSPAYVGLRGRPVCRSCAMQALQTARSWYGRRGNNV